MKSKNHLIIAIICFTIAIFETIVFKEIIDHPYMVGLLLTLCVVGGYNLGFAFIKFLNNK